MGHTDQSDDSMSVRLPNENTFRAANYYARYSKALPPVLTPKLTGAPLAARPVQRLVRRHPYPVAKLSQPAPG